MERIGTGNPELDRILDGGFPANSIHIIMGSPGSGKTILAEQIAFANATEQRPALYLTTISEPLPKFLTYLHEYSFADPSWVGTAVIYENVGDQLMKRPERLSEQILELVQNHRPQVIVIDSFKAISELMPDRITWRRHLHDLAGLLSAYNTTSFWVGEYMGEASLGLPEFAVADGVLELKREQFGTRDFRFLRVIKLRGSYFLDGYHSFRIHRGGLRISPRLVTPTILPEYNPIDERLGTGIEGLDRMIATGWLRGSTTLLIGPSGSGKSVISLQFAREGALRGEPSLFVSLEENPVQLARVMRHFGWDPASLIGSGQLDLLFVSPVELQIDTIVSEVFRRIEQQNVRRVVIDGLGDLASTANDLIRFRDYIFTLTQEFAKRNVTAIFTVEANDLFSDRFRQYGISFVGANILLLEVALEAELTRSIRVIKTRGSAHDARRHSLAIGPGGVVVG